MRQHPLRRERLEEQPMETETPQPPREEDVDNEMMKNILGQMYKDKDYLEKLLSENGKCVDDLSIIFGDFTTP